MRRVVYCPQESQLPQAESLAKLNNLPINIGFFEEIKNVSYSEDTVQILEIPENKELIYNKNIKNNFHQNIIYFNDFIIFNLNCILLINNIRYKPILKEKHKIVYNVYESFLGLKNCQIIQDNKILESFDYNVY